ncbi:MAG: hypothetical protein V7609_2085 [Verrucomicrobiota bacterium]
MSAPTIAELLAGDISIEEVWAGILSAAGLSAIAFSDGLKSTPYVEIEFEETQVTDHIFPHVIPGSDPAVIVQYRDCTRGSLVTRICTVRGVDSEQQKSIIGTVRRCAQEFRSLFNTDALPYHGINLFTEAGKKQYVDTENRLDKTELRHVVHFNIRSDAWPTG